MAIVTSRNWSPSHNDVQSLQGLQDCLLQHEFLCRQFTKIPYCPEYGTVNTSVNTIQQMGRDWCDAQSSAYINSYGTSGTIGKDDLARAKDALRSEKEKRRTFEENFKKSFKKK